MHDEFHSGCITDYRLHWCHGIYRVGHHGGTQKVDMVWPEGAHSTDRHPPVPHPLPGLPVGACDILRGGYWVVHGICIIHSSLHCGVGVHGWMGEGHGACRKAHQEVGAYGLCYIFLWCDGRGHHPWLGGDNLLHQGVDRKPQEQHRRDKKAD